MAADDDRDGAPDPWDEIIADSLGDGPEEVSFRFEEAAAEGEPAAVAPEDADTPAEFIEAIGEAGTADAAGAAEPLDDAAEAADNALVEDWLSGDDDAAGDVPPLSVFAPADAAGGSSAIDIGTGESGIALHGETGQEEIGTDAFTDAEANGAAAGDWPAIDTSAGAATEDVAVDAGLPDLATGAAAAAAGGAAASVATKTVRRPAKPAKKGGIGQVIGIVLGALLAFPIVGGILIGYAWMGGRDAIGLRKTPLAFLMPPKSKPSSTGVVADGSSLDNIPGAASLDDLATATEPVAVEPETEPDAGESDSGNASLDDLAAAGTDEAEPVEPEPTVEPEPMIEPVAEPEPSLDAVAVDEPAVGALDALDAEPAQAVPAVPPAPPEPPPLDTAALDEAVVDAAALGEALTAVDDKENRAYMLLRTRWYRAIARVAEELVAMEDQAATTGRPLVGPPANVESLHGEINGRAALVAELSALAPDWLAYAKRGSDGVVLPLTFASARKVGPLWTIHATLTGADGQPRDLTVVTRREPAALEGDRVVVTGVALDGATIWAADVRAAEPAAGF